MPFELLYHICKVRTFDKTYHIVSEGDIVGLDIKLVLVVAVLPAIFPQPALYTIVLSCHSWSWGNTYHSLTERNTIILVGMKPVCKLVFKPEARVEQMAFWSIRIVYKIAQLVHTFLI